MPEEWVIQMSVRFLINVTGRVTCTHTMAKEDKKLKSGFDLWFNGDVKYLQN